MVEYERDYFTNGNGLGGYFNYGDFEVHGARVDKLIAITNPKSVLDVGCAYGFIVKRLLDKGIPAMGCDISKWCEDREIIPGHFVRTPTHDLSAFKDKQFDVLYCEGVLEHIEECNIVKTMAEFARVANKRYLALTFDYHANAGETDGHVCLHNPAWWFDKIPLYTWMFLGNTGTDGGTQWVYKG